MKMFKRLGLFLIEIGTKIAFPDNLNEDVKLLKNTINEDIALWSQIQTGGHSMRDVKPLSNIQMISVIPSLKKISFIDRHKDQALKFSTQTLSDYCEDW